MSEDKAKKGASGTVVRGLFRDAKPVGTPLSRGPEPGQPLNGIAPGGWQDQADPYGMPPWCPVQPLGCYGNTGYFIDPLGQLQAFVKPYGKGDIIGLFLGDANYLIWAWPRYTKEGEIDGFAAEKAHPVLLSACNAKGIWSAAEKLRGRGAWLSMSGDLLFHAGSRMQLGGRDLPTGEFEGHVYPARPAIPRPWSEPVDASSVRLLMPLLRSWNWDRPDIDPILLLGWIGAAWLGAAAPKRTVAFIMGDKATGKSTLQELLKLLFGDALIQSADTTAAGIYQRIGLDCLPVAIDELEAKADFRRQQAIIDLARAAYSGALMLRGGDRHQGVEFQARSCFLFSSINAPPLAPQDLSRMAILRLKRLPADHPKLTLDEPSLAMQGRMILRRMIDQWHRFGQTYDAFKQELAATGMASRAQETFGVLLACADIILHDGWDEGRLRAPTGGPLGPTIQRLEVPHNFDISSFIIEDERQQMKMVMMDDALPPLAGAVRSPTEIVERMQLLNQDIGGVFGRMTLEIVSPLVQRVIEILEKSGRLATSITIDQLLTQIRVIAPIAAAQQAAKVTQVTSWLQLIIGLFGPQAAMTFANVEELIPELGRWLGVEERFIRSKAESTQFQQFIAGIIAAGQQPPAGSQPQASPAQGVVNGGAL